MKYEKIVKDDIIILKILENHVDSKMAPELKKEFLAIIVQDTPNIIVDLSEISYMDSSGLGTLLFGRRQAERFQGRLVIAHPGPKVKKLIEIAHLTQTLMIFDSLKDASNSYNE